MIKVLATKCGIKAGRHIFCSVWATFIILVFFAGTELNNDTSLSNSDASYLGEAATDNSGHVINNAGDVNGDGYSDLLISSYRNGEQAEFAGQTYLIFGKASGWNMDASLSSADASFLGEVTYDCSGLSISSAGDVNGDGYDDILIGAYTNDETPDNDDAGQTYLIFGKSSGWSMDVPLSSVDASFLGETANDYSGKSVSSAGDVNGDGYDDILIGAYGFNEFTGQTYLILGKSSGWDMDVSLSAADASFIGESAGDYSGYTVCGAGDVNGDGYDDILIGAYRNGEAAGLAGQTYLILGKSSGWSMDVSLSSADASFWGEAAHDYSGYSISGAGDVNCDGYDDILVSSYLNGETAGSAGQTYLIFGKSSGWSMDVSLSSVDASFLGEASGDMSGQSVSGAGDVNGDGYSDILIGAYRNDEGPGSDDNGQTYLVYGKSSGWSMDVSLSTADASFVGEAIDDYSGYSVSGSGDVNGDGYSDLLIGAYGNDEGPDNDAGQTYIIFSNQSGATNATYKQFVGNGNMSPCYIDNANLCVDFSSCNSVNGYLMVTQHNNQDPPGATVSSVNKYWTITPINISDYTFDISFHYNDSEITESGGAEENMKLYRRVGEFWDEVTTIVNTDKNILTATNQSSFSDWAIGNSESPLPVELTSFSVLAEKSTAKLTWQTATETNNYGFFVERNVIRTLGGADGWQPIDFIPGAGNSNSPKEYRYIDELTDLEKIPERIEYRLKQTDTDGSFEYSDVVAVETQNFASLPTNFQLYQNYPNPFNPSTKIKFSVGQICNLSCPGITTTLKIYNSLGAEITTLVNELKSPGTYEVEWNAAGFASGIYFCEMKSGKYSETMKLILMK